MRVKDFFFRLRHWETWHYLVKYIPIAPCWFWYCLRSRSLWFFSSSNPTLTFGGFEGESKKEMYDQLPPGSYPCSIYIEPSMEFAQAESLLEQHGLTYPFAVKPDVGMMGFLFRKIRNRSEFQTYHSAAPTLYIAQEFIDYPLEVSVFYYRYPGARSGTITGFLKKEFLEVVGDGRSTLWKLIEDYPRVRFRLEEMRAKHESRLQYVLPAGEVYCLSPALNLSRGGRLVSLEGEKDADLLRVFDGLFDHGGKFYYGRYDIKCASIEDLKQGRNFRILEFNGSGAEPHHIYGNGHTLFQAYAIVLHHWKTLYKIARINHKAGIRYWSFLRGWRFLRGAKKHFRLMKTLDQSLEL